MIKHLLQVLYKRGRQFHNKLRTFWWAQIFSEYGTSSRILGRVTVYSPQKMILGSDSTVNEGVVLNARMGIHVGNHVHLSPGVIINTAGLAYGGRKSKRTHVGAPVMIEDGVWIGSGAMINPGVTIGMHSVVGAGAVVTKDVPANVVVTGIPAKVIKEIPQT